MKHSPGPWRILHKPGWEYFSINHRMKTQYSVVRPSICVVYPNADPTVEKSPNMLIAEANAHLISAAPELLTALKDLLSSLPTSYIGLDGPVEVVENAFRIIAKAEGRDDE